MGALEDLFGQRIMTENLEEITTDTTDGEDEEVEDLILSLDYAAGSIGVDLGYVYPVTKIVLTANAAETRITEDQVRLFTRPDRDPSSEFSLGLTLVQRILEKLDGEVGVESEVGKGSFFYFTLPAAKG